MDLTRRAFVPAVAALLAGCSGAGGSLSGENGQNSTESADSGEDGGFETMVEVDADRIDLGDGLHVRPEIVRVYDEMDLYDAEADTVSPQTFDPPIIAVKMRAEADHESVNLPENGDFTLLDRSGAPIVDGSSGAWAGEMDVDRADLRADPYYAHDWDPLTLPNGEVLSDGTRRHFWISFIAPPDDADQLQIERIDTDSTRSWTLPVLS